MPVGPALLLKSWTHFKRIIMRINNRTFLFEELSARDYDKLRDIEYQLSRGRIDFKNPFIAVWMATYNPSDSSKLLVASTVMHIRILQSIVAYMEPKHVPV
jgi:hypothetical protein